MMTAVALVVLTLVLAAANGANDVSKGIATLVGSGVSNYRGAVLWGTLCTFAGAIAATFGSQALVKTFNGGGFLVQPPSGSTFLLAVACGAAGWLVIATRTGLPVSTTHALVGALAGSALVEGGLGGVVWSAFAIKAGYPLLLSPLLSMLLLLVVLPLLRPLVVRVDRYCVCIEQREALAVTPEGMTLRQPVANVEVGPESSCSTAVARVTLIDSMHWISSGATSFFRGMNDAPKILALGVVAAGVIGASTIGFYLLVAAAMGIGSAFAGFRVTRTLAEKVTPISPANGFAANLVTSLLVGFASRFALPVSTTHVSSGAIIGVGISRGGKDVGWKTVREMLLAWIITLPVAAALAALVYAMLRG